MAAYGPFLRNLQIMYKDYRFKMLPVVAGALIRNLQIMYKDYRFKMLPIVVGALGLP